MRPSLHRLARHVHTHRAGEGEEEQEEEEVGVVEEVEVEGEEAKQHQGLQHTKASTGHVHPPGCKKSDRQRARGRGCLQPQGGAAVEVAMRVSGDKLWKNFKFNFTAKSCHPITSRAASGMASVRCRVVGYLPCVNGRATGRASRAAALQRRRMSADDADPLAGLSLKERELLQYLEDLQRNNPAEYDMIAKQIQEGGANLGDALGNGSKAGKKPPAPKGEMVTPEPGFVAKTHSFTHQARKTFINLCKSDHVDPPAQVEVPGGDLRSK